MVFFYFGPSASSWATGNDQFSMCRQLPPPIQAVWDSIGEHLPDRALAGTRIDWLSTGIDGSYCVMLKDGNVLSNRSDLLQSVHVCRQAFPYAVVDHVSFFAPYGAYLVRLDSGHVLLSPEAAGPFPDAFVGLAADFLHFAGPMRNVLQPTQLECVFWGPSESILLKACGGALRWQGLPDALVAELRALTVGVDMLSAGFQLGKRTTLCPWDGGLYFLEFASFLGNTAKAYPYSLRQHGLSGEAMQYVVVNQRPPEHLVGGAGGGVGSPAQLPPPLPLPPPPALPPTPPASAPPMSAPALPPRPQSQAQTRSPPPPPPPPPYEPAMALPPRPQVQTQTQTQTPVQTPPPPSLPSAADLVSPKSHDEERIDAFVHTLAMPADIRAIAEELWAVCTTTTTTASMDAPQYLTGSQAMQLFAASQLSADDLAMIWDKSDLDHNGLLDREEFLQAVYLVAVQQYLRGLNDQYGLEARAAAAGEAAASGLYTATEVEVAVNGPVLSREMPRDISRDAQPSLRGTVKDIFKLFMDAGSEIGQAYKQSYQVAQQQQQQQLQQLQAAQVQQQQLAQQQLLAAQVAHAAQAGASQQQIAEALEAMQLSEMGLQQQQQQPSSTGASADGADKDKDSKSGMAKQLRESLMGSIVTDSPDVHWDDVAGLGPAKDELQEAVIFPLRFPHMFQGKRKPRRAILLYGPPGTGKSYLAKAVATEVEYTLFSISASDLTSKWFGESESLVRQLFDLAREKKPSVIFIDELDALCNNRESSSGGGGGGDSDGTSARLKTEFLVQMDGVGHGSNEGVVLLAATNLPWSLDPAIRRRFQKRIHIPLPDADARLQLFRVHGGEEWTGVVGEQGGPREKALGAELARRTEGFSGSDVANAVQDALMLPVKRVRAAQYFRRDGQSSTGGEWWLPCEASDAGARAMTWKDIPNGRARAPPLTLEDFFAAAAKVKPSVGAGEIQRCLEWTAQFGLEGA